MLKLNAIHNYHVLEGLKKLPDESIDMVITSPPYWSLRDYGKHTDAIWGGDPNCKHQFKKKVTIKKHKGGKNSCVGNNRKGVSAFTNTSQFCCKCDAWKGQLGLEPSIDLFIEHLVSIFDEIKRVLKKTGTCWVNLGDTYYTKSGNSFSKDKISSKKRIQETGLQKANTLRGNSELPAKCLSLIPFRFAIEMVKHGWILRNDIIWHKPNCIPCSARDRFTVDFEHMFFFSKSKKYYFEKQYEPLKKVLDNNLPGRNKRCIWTICPRPFKDAHFAVFPEKLCEIPIKAGCPKHVCKKCGMPELILESSHNPYVFNIRVRDVKMNQIKYADRKASKKEVENYKGRYTSKGRVKQVLGCKCNAGYEPGVVLDPFMGSGTTALVANKQGKNFIGFELNPEYIKIAEKRLNDKK